MLSSLVNSHAASKPGAFLNCRSATFWKALASTPWRAGFTFFFDIKIIGGPDLAKPSPPSEADRIKPRWFVTKVQRMVGSAQSAAFNRESTAPNT
eukprot:5529775-Pyramimonas_sp.AAC.1